MHRVRGFPGGAGDPRVALAGTHQGPAALAAAVLKSVFAEVRPRRVVPVGHTLLPCDPLAGYAFPGNHTVILAAFAVALPLVRRRTWGIWALVFAVLMKISRVSVGAHYPHDVLAGIVVGPRAGLLALVAREPLAKVAVRLIPAVSGRKAGHTTGLSAAPVPNASKRRRS